MQNNRTEKAIKYLNSHKAKKCIIEAKIPVLKHLENCKALYGSARIAGNAATFILAICNRFRAGFTIAEYIEILSSLTADYTAKQIKFYDWCSY